MRTGDEGSHGLSVLAQVAEWSDSLPVMVTEEPMVPQSHSLKHSVKLELTLRCGHELAYRPLDRPHAPAWCGLLLVEQLSRLMEPSLRVE